MKKVVGVLSIVFFVVVIAAVPTNDVDANPIALGAGWFGGSSGTLAGGGLLGLGLLGAWSANNQQMKDQLDTIPSNPPKQLDRKKCQSTCKGLREQLKAHERKLRDYKKNPYAFDNKGFLGNASSAARRQQIINGRIRNLERQIDNFKRLLRECEKQMGNGNC